MSITPILAMICGLGCILLGNYLEGGHMDVLFQLSAGIIVTGGTIGATWLASTDEEVKHMFKLLPKLVRPNLPDRKKLLDSMVDIAGIVRRDGMLAVESKLDDLDNDFMKRGLRLLVDGHSSEDVTKVLELDMDIELHHQTAAAKVLEGAGSFSPTIGILGAVLGLIHTMSNIADPSKLGAGIAVAFVATLYGVGSANLFLIPMGNRLKKTAAAESEVKSMILTGLEVIASGANPRQVEETLSPYVPGHHKQEAA